MSEAGGIPGHERSAHRGSLRHVGETVTFRGWLYNQRSSGKLHFLEVRDGTGIVPVRRLQGQRDAGDLPAADHIAQESSIEVTGTVKKHGKIEGQSRSTSRT